jgi:hypothetical protein
VDADGAVKPALVLLVCALFLAGLALPRPAAAAPSCDPLDGAACLLPWPNDLFTRVDRSSPTGRRLALAPTATPATTQGRHIGVADLNRSDGFSPGSMIVTRVPGLDSTAALRRSGAVTVTDPARYATRDQPILLIDTITGRRHPVMAEIDARAASPAVADLLIRPATNLREGRRYVVALRGLKTAAGAPIPARRAFRVYRDGLASRDPDVRRRRPAMERIFATLARAGVARRDLYLAWDFTVASGKGIAGRMLSIRDRAFAGLGDPDLADLKVRGRSPRFRVTSVQDFTASQDALVARRIRGEVDVPCFLDRIGCPPGSRFTLDAAGMPIRRPGNVAQAPFVCQVPRSALAAGARPLRPVLYGHGLLGDRDELVHNLPSAQAADDYGLLFCATDWKGMSVEDTPTIATRILPDLTNFPLLADRVQQGMLDFLFVGRAMVHRRGFSADPAFRIGGRSAIDTRRLEFNGNSQGAIIGGALTAVAPDFDRSALGVAGMNYSTLLDRSTDFSRFAAILYQHYPRGVERPLLLALIQLFWDRAEGAGYAQHMTSSTYPDTPRHTVLLLEAFGDHQVANLTTGVEARTIGARLRRPALYPRRAGPWRGMFSGLRRVPRLPYDGTALVVMDSGPLRTGPGGEELGTPFPPVANVAPERGVDPHGLGGSSAQIRRLVARFLAPGGALEPACGARPCTIAGWTGP